MSLFSKFLKKLKKSDQSSIPDTPTVPLTPRNRNPVESGGISFDNPQPNESPIAGRPIITPRQMSSQPMAGGNYVAPGQVNPSALPEPPTPLEGDIEDRAILAANPNYVQKGTNYGPEKTPSRMRGFLAGFLQAASQGANQAMAQGNVGWGGVAQALGSGLGGGAAIAAEPGLLLKQRHAQAVAENENKLTKDFAIAGQQAKLDEYNSQIENRKSLALTRSQKLELVKQAQQDKKDIAKDLEDGRMGRAEATLRLRKVDQDLRARGLSETERHNLETEANAAEQTNIAQQRANKPTAGESTSKYDAYATAAESAQNEVNAYTKQLSDLDASAKNIVSYDVDANGRQTLSAARQQYQAQRKAVQAKLDDAQKRLRAAAVKRDANKPRAKTTTLAPASGTFSISKAVANGLSESEAKAKAERARAAGWTIVN